MSLHKAVKDVLDAIDQKGYVNTKNKKDEVRIEALRQAVADHIVDANKMVYKPMTDDEIDEITMAQWGIKQGDIMLVAHRAYAREVLARLGIEVGK